MIATPYPDTAFFLQMEQSARITSRDWDLYDTRHVVFKPGMLTPEGLKQGYDRAYEDFYRWSAIVRSSLAHGTTRHQLKHFFYAGGWKKFEPLWNMIIQLRKLDLMTPLLEGVLSKVTGNSNDLPPSPATQAATDAASR